MTITPSGQTLTIAATGGTGGGLTQVAHDSTLTGSGTSALPLGLADYAVTTAKLAGNSVTNSNLAVDAVTSSKIADGAVGPQDLANGAVRQAHLAAATPTAGQVLSYNGTNLQWVDHLAEANSGKTLLLFLSPWNGAWIDYVFTVANTGLDPIGTAGSSGDATIYYYGSGKLVLSNSLGSVAPGAALVTALPGLGPQPLGFDYAIVVCNFPLAHGVYFGTTSFGVLSGEAIVLSSARDITHVESRGQ